MTGDLTINGTDAYTAYGMSLEDGALCALLAPPPLKEYAEAKSRLRHGAVLIAGGDTARYDSRTVSLPFHIVAADTDALMDKYRALCAVLAQGRMEMRTRHSTDVYRMVYNSCAALSAFAGGVAKFTLRLTEPNPDNRGTEDTDAFTEI